jgi:chorismate-pyruvate lyase
MSDFLYPLPALYASAGREMPHFEVVQPTELSPGAHRLLVHAGDMTSKLEEFFEDDLFLRVIQCEHTAERYRREVLLCCAKDGLPVEYGAIEIALDAFAEPLRSAIVEARLPLGGLLNKHGVRYRSEPHAFLRIAPCAHLAGLFGLTEPVALYGRSNQLISADGAVLARIVEVLRPV